MDGNEILCPCGRPDNPSSEVWILCDNCHTWHHSACADLTDQEAIRLEQEGTPWFCNRCLTTFSTQNLVTPMPSSKVQCPYCERSFNSVIELNIHIGRKHPEQKSQQPPSCLDTTDIASSIAEKKRKIKVLKRIPKGARFAAATKLSTALDRCVSKNDIDSWLTLLTFAFTCLCVPQKTNKNKSLATLVKSNINGDALPNAAITQNKSTPLSRRVKSKVAEGDIAGSVKILSSEDIIAPQDSSTFNELLSKHPAPYKALSFPSAPLDEETLTVTDKEVKQVIFSFPNGSSSGIDGLRPQHLKDLISSGNGEAATRLIKSLTTFCNFVLSGKVNCDIVPIFYGANLCALKKKEGGLRPIAVGQTLRRLVAKLACSSVRDKIGDYLRPTQLGFATKGGCEAIIHATRTFINLHQASRKVVLKIDFKNAFNTINRDTMLRAVKLMTQGIFAFLWQAYYLPSILFFGEYKIDSVSGCQQGDPAGPLLFCLSIQPIIDKLKSDLVCFYLDDGMIAGEPESVMEDFAVIIKECEEIGLSINPSKCELFLCQTSDDQVVAQFQNVSPGIKVVTELTLLGAPITTNSIRNTFQKKMEELSILFKRITELDNYHIAYYLLRNCFAVPKMTYLLRTAPLWNYKDLLLTVDQKIKCTLEQILNVQLSASQHLKASLPIRSGGLGIRRVADISLPAFLSSIYGTSKLVNMMLDHNDSDKPAISHHDEALREWSILTAESNAPPAPFFQRNWDNILLKILLTNLTSTLDSDKAIMLAVEKPEANAWLNALPSYTIGTLLDNNSFRIAIGLRLGCTICKPHVCVCGMEVDPLGHHGLSCVKSRGRYSRHQDINNIILRSLVSAKIPSRLEPVGMSRDDGKRVDGTTLIPWERGKCLVWDATCTDTLAPSHLQDSCKVAGSAAKQAASLKTRKYSSVIDANYTFLPFAVETMGPWCTEAIEFVNKVGGLLALHSGEARSTPFLAQRIGIAIQRGNAVSVMGTFPYSESLSEIYYIL